MVPINTAHPIDHPGRLLSSFVKIPETHSLNSLMISLKKNRTVAVIVATWSTRSYERGGISTPKNIFARARCPELLTGRNSVRPWIKPKSTTL
jgi:hypothetical protein